MNLLSVWEEPVTVKPYETDFRGLWKPHCFFQAFQLAGTNHAEHLGVGYQAMLRNGVAWLLARLKLKILRLPELDEQLTVQTWPRGLQQKIFFMRDFFVLDAAGQKIAAASSVWLMVDVKKRALVKPDPAMAERLPLNPGKLALDEQVDKIVIPEGLREQFSVQARFSAVDMIGHVNNTRYIEWVEDCFSIEDYQAHELNTLQINYANEVKPGQEVSIQNARLDEKTHVIAGVNRSGDARAFEALWTWK